MTIHKLAASHLMAEAALQSQEAPRAREKDGPKGVAGAKRPDRVEISPEARVLASQNREELDEGEGLSERQLNQIRQRMLDGFYDLPSTAEEVARRILASGDLSL